MKRFIHFKKSSTFISPLLVLSLFILLIGFGCEGGTADPIVKAPLNNNPMNMVPGGNTPLPMGGMPMGGMPMGGMPMGGMPMGGMPVMVDPNNCGLNHDQSIETFKTAVLPAILAECTATCHASTANDRNFKFGFDAANVDDLDETQIQEALTKVGEYITPGNGQESQLAQDILNNHVAFDYLTPPYTTIVEWINAIPVCP